MSGIKDQEKLDDLRRRLYERGGNDRVSEIEPNLPSTPVSEASAATTWESPPATPEPPVEPVKQTSLHSSMPRKKNPKRYRWYMVAAAAVFFVLAVGFSSLFLLMGTNTISGENISVNVAGPFTIGGGEVLPLQVGVINSNAVAIEAATLIVEYPLGTRSAGEDERELFTERLTLDTINSGETLNIPLRAVVFGEENEEQTVAVAIEYRVSGSNATFFKEAESLRYKISSSPIVVRADVLKKVSSGQETDVNISVTSNSPTPLSKILVIAEYPLGFDFTEANIEPTSGENMWLIENLEPESSAEINITGTVVGKETDEHAVNFTVGVPNERDERSLASVFATAQTEFEIEQPFLAIELEIAGDGDGEVVVDPGQQTTASIDVKNTLADTLYDIVVTADLSGNALSDLDVGPPSGFYDSVSDTITWDVTTAPDLAELTPGDKTRLTFTFVASEEVARTPQVNVDVSVKARRVSERDVAEELIGTAESKIKVVSIPNLLAETGHNNGIFVDSGPVPPVAERVTKYTLSLMVENGTNDIDDAIVQATLPPYVTYLDQTSGTGELTFNPTSRTISWRAGDVNANAAAFASFQVSFRPSKTQVDATPVLMNEQRLTAIDRFTDAAIDTTNAAITTSLPTEAGFSKSDGRVQPE